MKQTQKQQDVDRGIVVMYIGITFVLINLVGFIINRTDIYINIMIGSSMIILIGWIILISDMTSLK